MEETSGVLAEFLLLQREREREGETVSSKLEEKILMTTETSRIYCKAALRSHCT